jgi:16S rRNA (cytidine1402-2'-O)-methyltransferase
LSDAPGSAADQSVELANRAATLLPDAAVPGALHVVSTPIGHLGDISLRALAVLQQVAAVCCEDTRQTHTLLARFGIRTPTLALHEHNEAAVAPRLVTRLKAGESLAIVSDAGTPLVSDPGARLVEACIAAGVRVVPIPGASATLAALVGSGMVPHPCTILGFLPRKGGERREMLALALRQPHAVVLFESPHRLVETLRELAEAAGGPRNVAVARELTKHFEEFQRGTLLEVAAYYEETPPRGEIVIVLAGATVVVPTEDGLRAVALALRAEGVKSREIVQRLVDQHGASRNVAYRLAHEP